MLNPNLPELELLKSVLQPLLEDFQSTGLRHRALSRNSASNYHS